MLGDKHKAAIAEGEYIQHCIEELKMAAASSHPVEKN
jgi:hypothetical protein